MIFQEIILHDFAQPLALSHDAGRHGAKRLKLDLLSWHPYLGANAAA